METEKTSAEIAKIVIVSFFIFLGCSICSAQSEDEYLIAASAPMTILEYGTNSPETFLDECVSRYSGVRVVGAKSDIRDLIKDLQRGIDGDDSSAEFPSETWLRAYLAWKDHLGNHWEVLVGGGRRGPFTGIVVHKAYSRYLTRSEVDAIYDLLPIRFRDEYRTTMKSFDRAD